MDSLRDPYQTHKRFNTSRHFLLLKICLFSAQFEVNKYNYLLEIKMNNLVENVWWLSNPVSRPKFESAQENKHGCWCHVCQCCWSSISYKVIFLFIVMWQNESGQAENIRLWEECFYFGAAYTKVAGYRNMLLWDQILPR